MKPKLSSIRFFYGRILCMALLFMLWPSKDSLGQVTANFVADTTEGCGVLSGAQFTDLSTGNITSWLWTFGNGNTSNLQNPSASYAQAGNYTVQLIVSDGNTSDTLTRNNYINVYQLPDADYSLSPDTGCNPLDVTFQDLTIIGNHPITTWVWDFGDGAPPVNQANVIHTYNQSGNYPTSLLVFDSKGCSDSKTGDAVQVTARPNANFTTSNPTSNCTVPYTVNFANITQNISAGTTFFWDFGDGTTSTQRDPMKTYTSLGTYSVKLVVDNGLCKDSITRPDFINLANALASFTFPKDSFCYLEEIPFTNQSQGAAVFVWDFGDGNNSSLRNPVYTYQDSGWYQVKLSVFSGSTCMDDTTIQLYVQRAVADFTATPRFICSLPDTVAFVDQSTNAVNWDWRLSINPEGSDQYVQQNVDYIQRSSGSFRDTLIVTSNLGCIDSLVVDSSRVVELIDIDIFSDSTFNGCAPHLMNFRSAITSSVPIVAQKWFLGNGDSSTLAVPPIQSYPSPGKYIIRLEVENQLGCTAIGFDSVFVGSPVNPMITFDLDSVCVGDSITLRDTSGDLRIQQWLWNSNKGNFTVDNSPITKIGDYPDTGNVFIRLEAVYNGCTTLVSSNTPFYVKGPVEKLRASPDSCGGLTFSFLGRVIDADTIFWDFDDGNTLINVSNPSHTFANHGIYSVRHYLENFSTGCIIDDTIEINTNPLSPSIQVVPSLGCAPLLPSFTRPQQAASDAWYRNNQFISGAAAFTDSLPLAGSYRYKLVQTDINGCKDSTERIVKVYQPEARIGVNVLDSCFPALVEFIDSSLYDTLRKKVRWDFGNGILDSAFRDTISYPGEDSAYTVSLYVEDTLGCKDSIRIPDLIKIVQYNTNFITPNRFVCVGETVRFNNLSSGNNLSYHWKFGDGDSSSVRNPTHVYQTAGFYDITLIITTAEGCIDSLLRPNDVSVQDIPQADFFADTLSADCYPLPVRFFDNSAGQGIIGWNWDFDNGVNSVFQNPFLTFTQPGTYDITLAVNTSNGCFDTIVKQQYIDIKGPSGELFVSEDTVCRKELLTFEMRNAQNVFEFLWDFGDGDTSIMNPVQHSYDRSGTLFPVLFLSDSSGRCNIPLRDTLFVDNVVAAFTVDDSAGCDPLDVNFTNLSQDASSWSWDFGNGSNSVDFSPSTQFRTGSYRVRLSIVNANDCIDTAFQNILVTPKPVPQLNADAALCEGDSILLTASGGIDYVWEPTTYLAQSDSSQTWCYPDSSISYQVTVSNIAGCSAVDSLAITVQHPPTPPLLTDSNIIIGESLWLDAWAGEGFTYQWTPSKGLSCDNCPNPMVKPLESTLYQLLITDPLGCFEVRDSIFFDVNVSFTVDVPQAFTPNGDLNNDVVFVRGWGIKEVLEFKIFNRWGQMVFESNAIDQGWDGTYKGEPQNPDTYVYVVRVLTYGDEVLIKKGNLTLIR